MTTVTEMNLSPTTISELLLMESVMCHTTCCSPSCCIRNVKTSTFTWKRLQIDLYWSGYANEGCVDVVKVLKQILNGIRDAQYNQL